MSLLAPLLLFGAGAFAQPVASQEPPKRDVQCFILYAIGVAEATTDATKQAATLGLMYFYTKLRFEAPAANLPELVRKESEVIGEDPAIEEIGAACDSEFAKTGKDLMDLGDRLKTSLPPAPAT